MRRRDMNKTDKFRLEGEDMREDREFRQNIIESLAKDIGRAADARRRFTDMPVLDDVWRNHVPRAARAAN